MRCVTAGCDTEVEHLFCPACGKTPDPAALKRIRLKGFTGRASLNPNVEHFWQTGETPPGL